MDISVSDNQSGGRDAAPVSPTTIPTTPRRSWDGQAAPEPEHSVTIPPINTSVATTTTTHRPSLHVHALPFTPRPSLSHQPTTTPTHTTHRLSTLPALDPRPLEDLHHERSYLLHSLHRQSERATALVSRYATLQSRLDQTRKTRKEAAQLKSRIAESTQQEQLILLRLGEIWLELRARERWAVVQEQLHLHPEGISTGTEGWSGGGKGGDVGKKGKREAPSPLDLSLGGGVHRGRRATRGQSKGGEGEGEGESESSVLSPLSPCFVPRGSFSGVGHGFVLRGSVSGPRYGFESASRLGYGYGSGYSPGLESGYESGYGSGSVPGSGYGFGYSPASLEGEIWGREALSRVGVGIGRGTPLPSPLSQGFVSFGDQQNQAQDHNDATLNGTGGGGPGTGPASATGNIIFTDVLWEYGSDESRPGTGNTLQEKEKERPKSWSWYQRYAHGHGHGARQSLPSSSSVVQTPFPLKERDKRMSLPSSKTIWPRSSGVVEE